MAATEAARRETAPVRAGAWRQVAATPEVWERMHGGRMLRALGPRGGRDDAWGGEIGPVGEATRQIIGAPVDRAIAFKALERIADEMSVAILIPHFSPDLRRAADELGRLLDVRHARRVAEAEAALVDRERRLADLWLVVRKLDEALSIADDLAAPATTDIAAARARREADDADNGMVRDIIKAQRHARTRIAMLGGTSALGASGKPRGSDGHIFALAKHAAGCSLAELVAAVYHRLSGPRLASFLVDETRRIEKQIASLPHSLRPAKRAARPIPVK